MVEFINISKGVKRNWAEKDEEQREKALTQLALARDNIAHDKRKRNQKIGLANYWTPERRKEYGDKVRERNRRKKLEKEGKSL